MQKVTATTKCAYKGTQNLFFTWSKCEQKFPKMLRETNITTGLAYLLQHWGGGGRFFLFRSH